MDRKNETPVIEINADHRCSKCGEKGALKSGLCMTCHREAVSGNPMAPTLGSWPNDDPSFVVADEVEKIAERLIEEKKLLYACGEAKIAYLFKREMPRKRGEMRKVSGPVGFLAQGSPDFVMVINWDAWRFMSRAQRYRLVYHELRHIGVDDKGKLTLVDHEFEGFVDEWREFPEVIRAEGSTAGLFDHQLGLFDNSQPEAAVK